MAGVDHSERSVAVRLEVADPSLLEDSPAVAGGAR
jgi:hypothetical protein